MKPERAKRATGSENGPGLTSKREASAGYAAVDALVGLMILSTTLICTLTSAFQAAEVARFALEGRRASVLARYLIDTAPTAPGLHTGRTDGFSWKQAVLPPILTVGDSAVCTQRVNLVSDRSHRAYELSSNVVCRQTGVS